MINLSGFKNYDAHLTPCPFCGGERQEIMGVYLPSHNKWNWSIECRSCHATFKDMGSEYEVRTAWERRFKQDDIEENGYITWKRFRDRYVREFTERSGY